LKVLVDEIFSFFVGDNGMVVQNQTRRIVRKLSDRETGQRQQAEGHEGFDPDHFVEDELNF